MRVKLMRVALIRVILLRVVLFMLLHADVRVEQLIFPRRPMLFCCRQRACRFLRENNLENVYLKVYVLPGREYAWMCGVVEHG